ncbi:putative disease resistance RPP13-like protein 3 [Morus notabilis]|uniref:putative disease resistance RPP13-like protein 3 n=1 Tax=Morus notabilis TaxID=981085 RepID=UPI000CECE8EF|nr:putative disease resistance RPP13-like protein 3 [Morus notabilis]
MAEEDWRFSGRIVEAEREEDGSHYLGYYLCTLVHCSSQACIDFCFVLDQVSACEELMAETFLSPIIEKLEKLTKLLIGEAQSLKGVRKEVKILKDELEIIEPFLKDAEAKVEKGDRVVDASKAWLRQIREEAERIEDVVDDYVYRVEHHGYEGGFMGALRKACNCIKGLKARYYIASEIQDIKESLHRIKDRGVGYGLRPLEQGSSSKPTNGQRQDPRLGSLFMEEDEVVCIDAVTGELRRRLTEGESMRSVISLVGQGGIGKTTLAAKVYHDEVVKANFDCHAWITVSQSYDMKNLLRIISRQVDFPPGIIEEPCNIEELIRPLTQFSQTRRYVVVFDDVWQNDIWDVMKHALPKNNNGSRIIITTRNDDVAAFCNENPCDLVKGLQPWTLEMAWQLFCKKAFRGDQFEGRCPQELEQLSYDILRKCQGLPLVIASIAGVLSTKQKSVFEWQNVLNNLTSDCMGYGLPKALLNRENVKEGDNKTLEEVAEEYLNELIQRNLVLLETKYGISRECRVHDLMYEIISTYAAEWRFCKSLKGDSRIRSVFLFGFNELSKSIVVGLGEKCKLLKVLDFSNAPLDNLPKEVGNFFHLRYLCLRRTKVKTLPNSIECYRGVKMNEGIGRLEDLRLLTRVEAYPGREVGFTKELQKLRNIRSLSILKVTAEMGIALGASIEKMAHLKELTFSRLVDEPLRLLQGLPNLVFLRLHQTYDGEELHFKEGSFRKLKELRLVKLEGLKVVKIDNGALPLLEKLEFGSFPLMMEPTSFDIQQLTSLKSIEILDMPREFVLGLQPDGGPYYWKIQHAPSVKFCYKNRAGKPDVYKLGCSALLQRLQAQDVPPQPNYPPDNVFRPDRPAGAGLGSKKRDSAPPPIHGISKIKLKVVVFSLSPFPAPTYTTPFKSFHKVGLESSSTGSFTLSSSLFSLQKSLVVWDSVEKVNYCGNSHTAMWNVQPMVQPGLMIGRYICEF